MKVRCTNVKSKELVFERVENTYVLDGAVLDVKNIYYEKSSGRDEFFTIVIALNTTWKNRLTVFLQKSWLKQATGDDDEKYYTALNTEGIETCGGVELTDAFEGRVDGTMTMTKIYFKNNHIIAPEVKICKDITNMEACFFQRTAWYQKNFDMTFCNQKETFHIYSIPDTFKNRTFNVPVYSVGCDNLPWKYIMKEENDWEELYASLMDFSEDSEWLGEEYSSDEFTD